MSVFSHTYLNTNGLIFMYDIANDKKSWRGPPTTNLVSNADIMSGWNNYSYGTPVQFTTEFGTIGYRMSNAPSWNGVYRSVSLPSSGTYTFSAWARYIGGSTNNNGGTVYVSGWGGSDSAVATNRSNPGKWQRLSMTLNCTGLNPTFYLISYGGNSNGSSDYSSWEVTMPQVEAGSTATPFVAGTRASTSSLIDISPSRYTLTPSNITYNADGSFSFNGSNSCYDLNTTSLISGTQAFTIEAIYYTAASDTAGREIIGNYGTGATSNTLWFATHGLWINGASPYHIGAPLRNGTYHTAATRTAAGATALYKNGVLEATGSNSASIGSGYNWRIGKDVNGDSEPFSGKIYMIKVYNRALSATEIDLSFQSTRGRYGL